MGFWRPETGKSRRIGGRSGTPSEEREVAESKLRLITLIRWHVDVVNDRILRCDLTQLFRACSQEDIGSLVGAFRQNLRLYRLPISGIRHADGNLNRTALIVAEVDPKFLFNRDLNSSRIEDRKSTRLNSSHVKI